ncbi:MAG: hypothetical protein ACPG32_06250 [Akkermansiaceae bacterium]
MKKLGNLSDTNGVISILLGMIVIVFVAIGVSLLIESKILSSLNASRNTLLLDEGESLQSRINALNVKLDSYKQQEKQRAHHAKQQASLDEMCVELDSADKEIGTLKNLISQHKASMELLTVAKKNHQQRYRAQVRLAAVGQKFDQVSTRVGKVYEGVKITNVSSLGVKISHKNGGALLGYSEMPDEWRIKYMFTALEVATARAEEDKRQRSYLRQVAKQSQRNRDRSQRAKKFSDISDLYRAISVARMRYSSASVEASLARSKAVAYQSARDSRSYTRSYNYRTYRNYSTGSCSSVSYRPRYRIVLNRKSRTVPGSLETWDERAAKYSRIAARYKAQLHNLQMQLSKLDPSYALPGNQ